MERTKFQIKMLSCCFFAGGLLLAGCSTDDSIDVGEIDSTIGMKLNNFSVPLGNSEDITLGDVLDLKEDDCIRTDENGDYEFYKDGGDVTGAEPKVDPVKFANPQTQSFAFSFNPSSFASVNKLQAIPSSIEVPSMRINAFSFSNNDPIKEVVSLTHAKASSEIKLNLTFNTVSNLAHYVTLCIDFPKFLELELDNSSVPSSVGSATFENNKLTLTKINTNQNITGLKMLLKGITDFKTSKPASGDYVVVNSNEIAMSGEVNMSMAIGGEDIVTSAPLTTTYEMSASVSFKNDITLTEATGYFDPSIEIDDMGNINIGNDVPDFLKDDEVLIKLANPCIALNVTNTIDAKGVIDGQMIATYDDNSKQSVDIKGIIVKPHTAATGETKSTIMICRDKSKFDQTADIQFIELNGKNGSDDIAKLLNKIPKSITFTCSAQADKTYKGTIDLGKKYKIKPSYSFSAPLSLEPTSTIVYDDKVDGFYEDINDNDVDLNGQAVLTITGKITNKTPLDLELVPTAIDVNGNKISGITLESFNIIKSNLDGSAASDLSIKLTKDASTDLKKVKFDGITFKVKAVSADATTLNKTKHVLKIDNLSLSINSELSIDTDKKKD